MLQNINLECEGDAAYAICNNVELSYLGHVNPRCKSQREIKQKHLLLPPYGKKDTFMCMGPTCKLFYDITKKKRL